MLNIDASIVTLELVHEGGSILPHLMKERWITIFLSGIGSIEQ